MTNYNLQFELSKEQVISIQNIGYKHGIIDVIDIIDFLCNCYHESNNSTKKRDEIIECLSTDLNRLKIDIVNSLPKRSSVYKEKILNLINNNDNQ